MYLVSRSIHFLMGRKILFGFALLFLCMGFSLTLEQIFSRKNVSSQPSSNKEVVVSDQQKNGNIKPVQNFTILPITQAPNYNLSKDRHLEKEHWNAFSQPNPVSISSDGMPCILFWAKRIIIKFKNQTLLDLADEAFSQKTTVDTGNSNCSDENAMVLVGGNQGPRKYEWALEAFVLTGKLQMEGMKAWLLGPVLQVDTWDLREHWQVEPMLSILCSSEGWPVSVGRARLSLKFDEAENPRSLDIRFILTNYKLSSQSWFSLHRVEIIFNNSVQATFNATGIYALSSYSYHCQRVSSLGQREALLLPSDPEAVPSPWEVTFTDFQIQGFAIQGGRFSKARDCAASSSPAVLIGLAMSLILLLVLAYALHMLIYLRYLDRHYDFITSPAHFPPLRLRDRAEEKELLRSQGIECYELRSQQICKIYV